jgi:hypothetical protein
VTSNIAAVALDTASAIAERLADPACTPPAGTGRRTRSMPQSLSDGAAGVALLHIERARTHLGDWPTAHAWLTAAVRGGLSAGPDADLFFGAPALAFVLRAAAEQPGRYARALASLDTSTAVVTRRRLDQAHARIDRGDRPSPAEFDVIRGLAGLGAHYLHRDPHHELTRAVLSYLVRLAEPLRPSDPLPGWWTDHDPTGHAAPGFLGGHSNLGLAHGITGPLALLGTALRRGLVVDGQAEAIAAICAHLDTWRQDGESGPWWPQWITREERCAGRVHQPGPSRPSWCYGTPGIARALQIAAIATGDTARQAIAEHAFAACLSDAGQLGRVTDTGLCHGWSGLFQVTWRAAQDALTPTIGTHLPRLADLLLHHTHNEDSHNIGLLTGTTGLALALHTAGQSAPPLSEWDACLLIN